MDFVAILNLPTGLLETKIILYDILQSLRANDLGESFESGHCIVDQNSVVIDFSQTNYCKLYLIIGEQ